MKTKIARVVALAVILALSGCGDKGGAGTKVTGKVTLPDGQPLPGGRVDFRSATNNTTSAALKANGTYEIELAPGDYKVSVENKHIQVGGPPPKDTAPMPGSDLKYVPINPNYSSPDTSGLTVTVTGKTQTYDVPLK